MRIETLLHEEIESELAELKKMEVGSESYKTAVDGLAKLIDKSIDIDRLNAEHQEKIECREADNDFKQKQMDEERKDRWIKNGIAVAGILVPTVVTIWGTLKSIEFEKEGTITTIMGRGFIQKLLPKK